MGIGVKPTGGRDSREETVVRLSLMAAGDEFRQCHTSAIQVQMRCVVGGSFAGPVKAGRRGVDGQGGGCTMW